jgi:hypothetical protein
MIHVCSIVLAMRNVSDIICRENQNTHFMFNDVFSKIVPFMNMEKYCTARQDRDDNMAHEHCMLDI